MYVFDTPISNSHANIRFFYTRHVKFNCLILQSPKVCIAQIAGVHGQWPQTPMYDVAEIITFVTSRHVNANVDFGNN